MPFGKFIGAELSELPEDYFAWLRGLSNLRPPLRAAVEREAQRRRLEVDGRPATSAAVPVGLRAAAREIVARGFRACAVQSHPDRGGDDESMRVLLDAREALERVVGTRS